MAIRYADGRVEYEGCVVAEHEHMWMDGMLEIQVDVWDKEKHHMTTKQVGYYGIDGYNMCQCDWKVDVSTETARDIIKARKPEAAEAFVKKILAEKNAIKPGRTVEVVRGRKIKKGTMLECFWVGERETYLSRQYNWMHETEKIAGCKDSEGKKYWVKPEYLKNLTQVRMPGSRERKKFMKDYIARTCGENVMEAAAR